MIAGTHTSIVCRGCNKTVRVQGHQTLSSQLSPESDARGYKNSHDSKLLPVLHTSIVCSGRGGGEPAVQKLRSSTPVAVALGDTRRTFTYRRYSTHQRCVAAAVRRLCPRALTVLTAAVDIGQCTRTKQNFCTLLNFCRHYTHVQCVAVAPVGNLQYRR